MSFAPETHTEAFVKPEALLRVPVGLVSPLWGLFAGAAVSGAAWWWMTRWARIENLEAMLGAATKAVPAADPALAILTAPVPVPVPVAAAVEVAEAVAEPVVEATFEAPPEPSAQTVEAFTEAPLPVEPLGGEAAPISPVLEALAPEVAPDVAPEAEPAPKPKKATAPKPA